MAISFNSQGMNLDFSNPTWQPSSYYTYLIPPSKCVIGGMFINTYGSTWQGNQYLPAGTYEVISSGFGSNYNTDNHTPETVDGTFIRTGIAGGSNVAGSSPLEGSYTGLLIRRA